MDIDTDGITIRITQERLKEENTVCKDNSIYQVTQGS